MKGTSILLMSSPSLAMATGLGHPLNSNIRLASSSLCTVTFSSHHGQALRYQDRCYMCKSGPSTSVPSYASGRITDELETHQCMCRDGPCPRWKPQCLCGHIFCSTCFADRVVYKNTPKWSKPTASARSQSTEIRPLLDHTTAPQNRSDPELSASFSYALPSVVRALLSQFSASKTGIRRQNPSHGVPQDTDSPSSNGGAGHKTSRGSQYGGSGSFGSKRPHKDSESSDDLDERQELAAKRARVDVYSKTRSFACPFLKKDGARFARCGRHHLNRIGDVKQHLWRCHTFFCPRCGRSFMNRTTLEEHGKLPTICDEKRFDKLPWMSPDQEQRLRRPSARNKDDQGKWFDMWDILFPNHSPRPTSAYLDEHLDTELGAFRQYVNTNGPQDLFRIMQEFQVLNPDLEVRRIEYLAAFQAGLDAIYWNWRNYWSGQDGIGPEDNLDNHHSLEPVLDVSGSSSEVEASPAEDSMPNADFPLRGDDWSFINESWMESFSVGNTYDTFDHFGFMAPF
jgi:hypothetical protein